MSQQACVFETQIAMPVRLPYLLYLPPTYSTAKKWPLIVFLHGMGERGDDLELVKKHGIPKILEGGEGLPFIAVSPQCPDDSHWTVQVLALDVLLDQILANHAVDERRIYLTGLSMGGSGTWTWGAERPERFAALAPVCGRGMHYLGFPAKACALKNVPVWNFHGAKDPVVPIGESEKLVNALQKCGGNVRYTIYPEAEHDSWTETYANPELYAWFLEQAK